MRPRVHAGRFGARCLVLGAGPIAAVVAAAPGASPVRQAFDIEVPSPPAIARLADSTLLVYELHLTNFARTSLAPSRIEIQDAAAGSTIGSLDETALESALAPVVSAGPDLRDRAIPPGMRAVVYVELPLAVVPSRVVHRVLYTALADDGSVESDSVTGGETAMTSRVAPLLGPPLRGGPWVAVYAPGMARGHRRVLYAVGGRARLPGRFAVDWMRPRSTGGAAEGRAGSDGLGAEVLAVADAVVATTRDGVPEPDPRHRVPVSLADAAGNYVALKLDQGAYAFYEHLTPGLRVRPGDRVRSGQVIAALGATGHVTGPHLHFHVADALSSLDAEGLPYRIEGMQILGSYTSLAAFDGGGPWGEHRATRASRPEAFFPSPLMVVSFRQEGS